MMKVKSTLPNIISPAIMEKCYNNIYVKEGDKSIYRENKDAAHINVNDNDTETTREISEKL